MNAKLLEKVISRNDYFRLTEDLRDRVCELAYEIRVKMTQLDIREIQGYEVHRFNTNMGGEELLVVGFNNHVLEPVSNTCYLHGDFSCPIKIASNKECLDFLNSARSIVEELDNIETKKSEQIQKALDETKDL